MHISSQKIFVTQLKEISDFFSEALGKSKYKDASDEISEREASVYITRSLAAINRVAGEHSDYYKQAQSCNDNANVPVYNLKFIIGVVDALLHDVQSGYLKTFEEIIHADMFSDYLEMASHLISNGYKDAAAVVAGSTLEAHMKQLAEKYKIEVMSTTGRHKKADAINAELAKVGAYSKLDQKNITAWLGLRNDAAHGNYDNYDTQQVTLLISGIRDFITRNPA